MRVELAPMDGITDSPFRQICRKMGATHLTTEMIPSIAIIHNREKYQKKYHFTDEERPITFQVFGSNPEYLGKSVEILNACQPDYFELNAGCPSKKIAKNHSGAAMLKDIDNLKKCLEVIINSTKQPVTLKIRLGWDKDISLELIEILKGTGIKTIKIHGRLATERYKGEANWGKIKELKNKTSIPVIGNGDIKSYEEAVFRLENYTPHGVMIGRGARGNPWIFSDLNPSYNEKKEIMMKHSNLMIKIFGEKRGLILMRKHLAWYIKNFPGARDLRKYAVNVETYDDIKKLISMMKHENSRS